MSIILTDDGTLDTVLRCTECGKEMRYNYDVGPESEECALELRADYLLKHPTATDAQANDYADTVLYDEWIAWAKEDAEAEHECPLAFDEGAEGENAARELGELPDDGAEPTEPEEGDITTTDHKTFYQYGRKVLERAGTLRGDDAAQWYGYDARTSFALGTFGNDHCAALRAYMARVQYWPNVWFCSDHGNWHLMDLSEGGK